MRKRKKYVIGYDEDNQCVYGPNKFDSSTYIDVMGIKEVKKKHKEMVENNGYYDHPKIVIYKLIPIKIEDK